MWITGVGYLDERHFVHRGESATKWRILAFRRPLVRSELMMMIQISETWLYGGNGVPVGWHLEPRCLSRYIRITVCPWRPLEWKSSSEATFAVPSSLLHHAYVFTLVRREWYFCRFGFTAFWIPRGISLPSLSIWISQFSEFISILDEKELIVN